MAVQTLLESGKSVTYESEVTFRPEVDPHVQSCSGVKTCDFISFSSQTDLVEIVIIEMKSSAPMMENEEALNKYLQEIFEKLTNSLLLLISNRTRRVHLPTCPVEQSKSWTGRYPIHFILYITDFLTEWCVPIQDALRLKMRHVMASYGSAEVDVVNTELVNRHGWFTNLPLIIN